MTNENEMLNESNADQTNGGAATTQDVLRHHLSCLAKRDLSGMMADYAKFFTPDGVLRGSAAIREVFARLLAEFAKPGMSFEMLRQEVEATPPTLFGGPRQRTTASISRVTLSSCRTERS
jgi:hypothetical protein